MSRQAWRECGAPIILVHGGGAEARGGLGRPEETTGSRAGCPVVSCALPAAPGPAQSSRAAWGGQGLWKLREMLTAVAVDTRVRAGRWGGGGRKGWLSMLSQPPSSPEGSLVCAPQCPAGRQPCVPRGSAPLGLPPRVPGALPRHDNGDVPDIAQCPMEWGFRITSS